ncbi:MAG: leucine-rich repeat domain-containing protein [Lachnospiraceae bacterium]|nr:leucine-rich repeat domain-containing protein [Lachnospiraceae bacterium]
MKVFKKIVVLVLAISLFTGLFGVSGVQAKEEKAKNGLTVHYTSDDGIQYNYWVPSGNGSDTCRVNVVGYVGKSQKVVIPSHIGQHRVYRISAEAFKDNTTITSVEIPGPMTDIGASAFEGCTNLKSVTFGNPNEPFMDEGKEVQSNRLCIGISRKAFKGCTSLEEIVFPYNVDESGDYYNLDEDSPFIGSGLKKATVLRNANGSSLDYLFHGAEKLEVLNLGIMEDNPGNIDLNQNWNDIPSLREVNIYNAEYMHPNHIVWDMDTQKSMTMFNNCPNLKTFNLYYNDTTEDGKPAAWKSSTGNVSKVPVLFLRTCPSDIPAYQDKSFIAVSSDESVVKIISDGRSNEMELIGPGEATITYKDMPFNIVVHVGAGQQKKNIADAKLTMPLNKATYTGKEIEPYFYIVDGKTVLEQDKDYTVEVKDNVEIGTGTVTVTGKGDYTGTLTASFTINPGPVIAKSVVIGKKKSVITLNADKQADGYQIYYSSKKSKNYKKLYSGTDLKAEVSGLKSGMYIKVRTYKKVGKTTLYSEWSAPVQVK